VTCSRHFSKKPWTARGWPPALILEDTPLTRARSVRTSSPLISEPTTEADQGEFGYIVTIFGYRGGYIWVDGDDHGNDNNDDVPFCINFSLWKPGYRSDWVQIVVEVW